MRRAVFSIAAGMSLLLSCYALLVAAGTWRLWFEGGDGEGLLFAIMLTVAFLGLASLTIGLAVAARRKPSEPPTV